MQLGNVLVQGVHSLLLLRVGLLQLLDVPGLTVPGLLEVLHPLQHRVKKGFVRQRLQREIAVGDHQLHPGRVMGQPLQSEIGVIAQKQDAVARQCQAVGGHAEQPVVRKAQVGDAAGQLTRVKPQSLRGGGQLKGRCHGTGQLVADIVGGGQGVPLGEAEARIKVEQRLQKGGGIGVHLALGVGRQIRLYLFFQVQAACRQPGTPLVREFELLFQVRNAAAQSRFRSFVVHSRILLSFYYSAAEPQKFNVSPHTACVPQSVCGGQGRT